MTTSPGAFPAGSTPPPGERLPIPPGYDVPEGYVPPPAPPQPLPPPWQVTAGPWRQTIPPLLPPAPPLPPPRPVTTPRQAVSGLYRSYAVFSGRASRREFCWASGFFLGVSMFLFVLIGVSGNADPSGQGVGNLVASVGVVVWFLFIVGTLLPLAALSVRRLHDVDLPGPLWFLNLIPYVGTVLVIVLNLLPSRSGGSRFDVVPARRPGSEP